MKFIRIIAILAALLVVSAGAFAQLTTGNLTGTVTSAGAALPGATVTVASPNLQGTRTAVTDSNGNYNFNNLPPGNYTVTFELQGLQTAHQTVHVGVSQTTRADSELKVSSVAETITVTANAPAVLETTQVQTNITAKLVENLPMGRSLVAMTNLAPNVTTTGPGGNIMISGGQSYDSTYYVDGAVVNEVLRGQPQNLFIEDALQETTVQTGAISSEFGRFTGGVVTAVSKTGGNQLTGSLRDTVERPSWTSQPKFAPFVINSNKLQQTYEGTLGGPIVRDRLWFFTAGRYFKIDEPRTFRVVPGETLSLPYTFGDKERRLEAKLTGQLTPKHSLTGTYFDIKRDQVNNCQGGCYDPASLQGPRSLPNKFYTANYSGTITNNFFLEGDYAKQQFKFVGGGGVAGSPETSTPINLALYGGYVGNPLFCGNCSASEIRNNQNMKLKGSYFWSPKNFGTHNLSVGAEDFTDYHKGNNEQSGSNFILYTYNQPTRDANHNLLLNMTTGNGLIIWFPILQSTVGSRLDTRSLFANDKWDFGSHLSVNVGARYDHNHGTNQAGQLIAKDSKISPRVGVTYDVFSNGKLRLNGSYSQYVSKIASGNVADASSGAGAGSYLYWYYYGNDITNATPAQMRQQVFNWFNSVGGVKNTEFLAGGATAGITTVVNGTLKSPGVNEYTFGAGTQLGSNAFLRADYQNRKWNNFYTNVVNTTTGKVFDPLYGGKLDLNIVTNTNDFTRKYQAIVIQGGWRPFSRLDLGGNVTHSKLRGNIVGENSGGGPFVSNGPGYYPEIFGYANANPVGPLAQDQPNKVRAWASYDQPTPIGNFNFSLLHRYDSGTPYSAVGTIYLVGGGATGNANSRCPTCPRNTYGYDPAHINNFTSGSYFFGPRGQYRTQSITADDVAVNYSLPISRGSFFVEAKAFNVFNRQAITNPNATVYTSFNSGKGLKSFNPFTGTPIECPQGASASTCSQMNANYQLGPNFGKPTIAPGGTAGRGTAGDVQFPRTYRVSLGLRF